MNTWSLIWLTLTFVKFNAPKNCDKISYIKHLKVSVTIFQNSYCSGNDRLQPVKWKKRRKQVNLKAVGLHLSLRQLLQSALPARKTRKEQPDGGGAVVLSSSQGGGGLLCHVIEISKSWSTLLYFSLTGAMFAGVSLSSLIIKQRSPLFCRLKGFPNLINAGRNNNNKSINSGNMASSVLSYFCSAANMPGCGRSHVSACLCCGFREEGKLLRRWHLL